MQIIELVVQGVRRFKDSFKIQLKPGLIMAVGGSESGKTTLVDTIEASLFPADSKHSSELVSWETPELSRGAIVFRAGPEDGTYRIVRDFVKNASSLSKLDPETKKFMPIAGDSAQIDTVLKEMGLPSLEIYHALCVIHRLDSEAPGAAGFGSAVDELSQLSPEVREQKIREIKEALEGTGKLDQLQYELDGYESEKFDLMSTLKRADDLEAEAKKAEEVLDQPQNEKLGSISAEQEERIRNHDEKSGERKRELDHLEKQMLSFYQEADAARAKQVAPYQHPIVMAGIGVILLGFILWIGMKMSGDQYAPHASKSFLLVMAGAALAGFGYLQWMKLMQDLKEVISKPEKTEQQRNQLMRKYDVESADVISVLRRTESDTPRELLERLVAFKKLKATADKARAAANKAREAPEVAEAAARLKEVTAKIKETQMAIKKAGAAAAIDPAELRRQLDRLENAGGNKGVAGVGAGKLIAAAASYLDESPDGLAAAIMPRASAHLQTITENRYSLVSLSSDGSAGLRHLPSSRERLIGELGSSVLTAFQFAVHGALMEFIADRKEKLPLLVDCGTGTLDDRWLAGLFRVLKAVGGRSQVILTTSRAQVASMADLAIKLPA